jgi:hypothetical protein
MAEHIPNIGTRGARRRRCGGVAWLTVAAAIFVALVGIGAPREGRLLLAIPLGLAAFGFLQARQKT